MKLYIETSVPNMLFHDDAPDKLQVTAVFFPWLQICPHELCVSPLVEQELDRAPEPRRRQLQAALLTLPLVSLPITPAAKNLAEALVSARAIPRRFEDDALHLAIAICQDVDVVVSWNIKHLVNPRRSRRSMRSRPGAGMIQFACKRRGRSWAYESRKRAESGHGSAEHSSETSARSASRGAAEVSRDVEPSAGLVYRG